MTSISFIGSGLSGLAAYALLAARNSITVYEKDETIGASARTMQAKSFV